MILIDSNVCIAAVIETHVHHEASFGLLQSFRRGTAIIAAHSLAECYSTLTRGGAPYRWTGARADAAIEVVLGELAVVALTAAQTRDAIRRFSAIGTGPQIYDYLIGATGEAHGARTIVTWNTRHFAPLFPHLAIVTPDACPPPLRS